MDHTLQREQQSQPAFANSSIVQENKRDIHRVDICDSKRSPIDDSAHLNVTGWFKFRCQVYADHVFGTLRDVPMCEVNPNSRAYWVYGICASCFSLCQVQRHLSRMRLRTLSSSLQEAGRLSLDKRRKLGTFGLAVSVLLNVCSIVGNFFLRPSSDSVFSFNSCRLVVYWFEFLVLCGALLATAVFAAMLALSRTSPGANQDKVKPAEEASSDPLTAKALKLLACVNFLSSFSILRFIVILR